MAWSVFASGTPEAFFFLLPETLRARRDEQAIPAVGRIFPKP